MWTVPELIASLPAAVFTDGWKVSASHHADAANDALTLTTWNAGAPQQAGMWFQVELPHPQAITEIQFESPAPGGRAGGQRRWGGLGGDVIAPGHARELAAGEQHEVEERPRDADRRLDPAAAGELGGRADGHGGRL